MIKQLSNSVIAKYCDLSMSRRSIICLSLRLRQIIDLLATDKSQYFAQPRPIIVKYFAQPRPIIVKYLESGSSILIELEVGDVGFCGLVKTGETEKKTLDAREEPATNSTRHMASGRNRTRATLVRGGLSQHCVMLAPQNYNKGK